MDGGDPRAGRGIEHVLALTRRHEFHLLGERCFAVRDRATGRPVANHPCVGAELRGSRDGSGAGLWPGALRAGARMVFATVDGEQVSGELLSTERLLPDQSQRALARLQEPKPPPASRVRLSALMAALVDRVLLFGP